MNTDDYILTDEAFKTYVRNHHKFTLEHLSGESLTPELVVITRGPELKDEIVLCCLAVPFNEAKEKHDIMTKIGKKFFEEETVVLAVILVSEAWLSTRPIESKEPLVQPRHDPNRKEHIIVVGSGMQQNQRIVIATPIKRDGKNRMHVDGAPNEMTGGHFALLDYFWRGYFATLLEKQPT